MPEHGIEHGLIDADQHAVKRVFSFVRNPAADPIAHQHRNQRDRQPGSRRHGVGFGKRQGAEQAPFLSFQREHRNKGQRDDQQRKKKCRAHFACRIGNHFPARFAFQRFVGVRVVPDLDFFVRVFNHHYRGVDHRADGNGDAAERHDVGVDSLMTHDDEGNQHTQRQRNNRHQ